MILDRLTITGADDAVSPETILRFSESYPFLEWGLLFSKDKMGESRYPSTGWLRELLSGIGDLPIALSAHFCGWYAKEVLVNCNYDVLDELDSRFGRVQLNYNFYTSKGWNLDALFGYLLEHPERSIILQYNTSNARVLDKLMSGVLPDNLHLLYDSSGGRGVVIKTLQRPFVNFTGYSGGLRVENIQEICKKLNLMWRDVPIWLDLETGVRNEENKFDMLMLNNLLKEVKSSGILG